MASVSVRGSARATVAPDRAVVRLDVSHLANSPDAALDEVARRSNVLAEVLAGLGIERTDWVTEVAQVAEEWQWQREQNVLVGHRAQAGVAVTVRALDSVGPLLREAVTAASASVRSLAWEVDAANPVRRALLGEAARDARSRAEAYATALGLRLGEVELVSEAPLAPEPPVGPMPRMMAAKAETTADVAVSEGLVELEAEVHVRFGLLAGT